MTKVEQARDIFNDNHTKTRQVIITMIAAKTGSGEAYASTLYNKARKLGVVSDKIVSVKSVDKGKVAFVNNCWKVQGLKGCHYGISAMSNADVVQVIGVNKNKELVCVKQGTNVRVKVDTLDVMTQLREMKFLGQK